MKAINPKLIYLKNNNDLNGNLVSIEDIKEIPMKIKRIFFIYGIKKKTIRGKHANRNSEFLIVCLSGSCKVRFFSDSKFHEIVLDKPTIGLYLPKMIWKEMYNFSKDSILLVISNLIYDKNEYIRDFDEYLKELNNEKN
jgi:dTDP-4-dehydrorhamnose 3,5-epimerase-like enzyme